MPEILNCPQCERKLKVPDTLLGKTVKCPTCGTTFTAAVAAPPSPAEEEPAEAEVRDEPTARKSLARRQPADVEEEEEDQYEDRPRRRRRRGYLKPHRGTMILVLGILSVVGVASIILGPMAWIMGNNDLQEMRAGRMDREGEGQTNAGRICGMIATILSLIGLVCCVGYFIFVLAMVGSGAGRNF